MTTCIALLRGINVGTAKRVGMAELRTLFEELGHGRVRTLLNSGNVVFEAARPNAGKIGASVDQALQAKHGFSAVVIVLTAAELNAVVRANPLLELAKDPARHLVAFVARPTVLAEARTLLARSWKPDAIAIGPKAAYLWCAKGLIKSELMKAFSRLTRDGATTRNWATVLKLQAMLLTRRCQQPEIILGHVRSRTHP